MKTIARDDVQNLLRAGAYLIEVLPAKQYREVHLEHAQNIPLGQLGEASTGALESTRPVIVYCYDFQ